MMIVYHRAKSEMNSALAAYQKEQARLVESGVDSRERRRRLEPYLRAWQAAEFNFKSVRRAAFLSTIADLEDGRKEKLSASSSLSDLLLTERIQKIQQSGARRGESFGSMCAEAGLDGLAVDVRPTHHWVKELKL